MSSEVPGCGEEGALRGYTATAGPIFQKSQKKLFGAFFCKIEAEAGVKRFMKPATSSPRSAGSSLSFGRSLCAAALAFVLTSAFLAVAASANPAPSSPPRFPDAIHVREGCFISSVAYLAKFEAEFPGEFGAPVAVHPRIYPTPHTVALVTWAGEWWLRDEFVGVLRLNMPVVAREITVDVKDRAEKALDRRVRSLSAKDRAGILSPGLHERGAVDAAREVDAAEKLIPFAVERFHIMSGGRETPVLFFRPSPGKIAVYDARFGTAAAETAMADSAMIVGMVAEHLGYKAASVRPALSLESGLAKGEAVASSRR